MAAPEDKSEYSEGAYTKSADKTKFPFYIPNIDSKLVPETRELLEKYSHIAPEQQSQHVHAIRDKAWDIRAYPCTGLGAWLVPQLRRLPNYPEILKRVQDGATLLDVGCFVGHDLRRLVYDGAPSERLYGVDIANHWDVGFDMFRDRDRFKAHFIEADILSESSPALAGLKGAVDIISVLQVLHQWDWDGQVRGAKTLCNYSQPGSMVVGNQIGNFKAQKIVNEALKMSVYHHDAASFAQFWDQVAAETGTKWETQAWVRTFEEMSWEAKDAAWMEEGVGVIEFVARRTA